jgi:hypothetical protein
MHRQVADEDPESARRQGAAVEVDQVDAVVALQVGLYFVAVLVEQT